MSAESQSRDSLKDSLALARQGKFQDALGRLDASLQQAIAAKDDRWIALFARNAAIVAEQSEDWTKAEHYYRLAIQGNEADPGTHFALGDLYKRLGNEDLAVTHFARCHKLASASKDESSLELLRKVGFKPSD